MLSRNGSSSKILCSRAASLPVAYLTAQVTLTLAGFKPGKTVHVFRLKGRIARPLFCFNLTQSTATTALARSSSRSSLRPAILKRESPTI